VPQGYIDAVMAAAGFELPALTAGALFYLASSTLAAATLFLLVELVERARQIEVDPPGADDIAGRLPAFGEERVIPADANLDDEQVALVGRVIPGAVAFLALAFLATSLVVAGLPPLSGFVGKLAMLTALADAAQTQYPRSAWLMFGLLLASGLLSTVALSRAFIAHFWATQDRTAPQLRVIEVVPAAMLLGGCILLAAGGEHALRYTRAAANDLHVPQGYIDAVMATRPRQAEGAR
jgi:multicomponent K+:H+ antiporter subunit D